MSRYSGRDSDRDGGGRRGGSDIDTKIYVGDLPRDAHERDLERTFSCYGRLRNVWVARNPAGFAFVEFEDPRDADDAVRGEDGKNLCGSRIRVEHSTGKVRPKPWLRGGRGPPPSSRNSRRPFDPTDKCYECGFRGHYAYDCSRYKGGGGGGRDRERKSSYSRKSRSRSYSRSRSRSRSRAKARSYSRSHSRSPVRSRSRSRSP